MDTQKPRGEASLARQQLFVNYPALPRSVLITYGQNSPLPKYDLETYRRVFDSATNESEWELDS
ncbi:MAG TPA: hypothetical protein VF088_05735, partial [Pyrinomonadaceae bacterium]